MARDGKLSLAYKVHAMRRESERGLYVPDVLHVLKHGFVYAEGVPATRPYYYKYVIEGPTPNSGGRSVALVVIPDEQNCTIKLVTIMWIDETSTRAGTIVETK
uniref:DUF4258 domain-containing protein n=1 Tax=Paracoccus sp. TRP TaxID=412597 RepID=UPI000493C86D